MRFYSANFLVLCFFLFSSLSAGHAEDRGVQRTEVATGKRTALVIGNSAYNNSPLQNPGNDARDMAALLEEIGFEVIVAIDANEKQMKRAINKFSAKLKRSEIGLFFFAGHGIQVNNTNYLIPVNADVQSESDIEFEAVEAGRILGKMREAGTKLNIVILDACRNNPFKTSARSVASGLARMDAPEGTILVYATSPGKVAADGHGRNGLYTGSLLRHLSTPGITVQQAFNNTGMEVLQKSNRKQMPWMSSTPIPPFYLAGSGSQPTTSLPPNDSMAKIISVDVNCKRAQRFYNEFLAGREGKTLLNLCDYKKKFAEYNCENYDVVNTYLERLIASNDLIDKDDPCGHHPEAVDDPHIDPDEPPPAPIDEDVSFGTLEDNERDFNNGNNALKEKLFPKALRLFKRAADNGMPEAAKKVGAIYANGLGSSINKDNRLSRKYYQKAKTIYMQRIDEFSDDSIDSRAQALYEIATLYRFGQGVSKNILEAIAWYEKAEEFGHYEALLELASIYYTGNESGVNRNYDKACQFYEKAANIGDRKGQYLYASLLTSNACKNSDDSDSPLEWFSLAAEQGHLKAQITLAAMYQAGIEDRSDADNLEDAEFWFEQAIENEEASQQEKVTANIQAARFFKKQQQFTRAFEIYNTVIDQGSVSAIYELGLMYMKGEGCQKNRSKALALWEKAAEKGNIEALAVVAADYGKKYTDNPDPNKPERKEKALYWLKKAEQERLLQSILYLSIIRLVDKKYESAQQLMQDVEIELIKKFNLKKFSSDDIQALVLLGRLYHHGLLTPTDKQKAKQYWSWAKDFK